MHIQRWQIQLWSAMWKMECTVCSRLRILSPFKFNAWDEEEVLCKWPHEFAPGRGAIHLLIVAIARDMAYLQDFYHAKTVEDKAAVVNKYAREHLDMTADVKINNDKQRRPEY
jgi:hypothetical protein